MGFAAQVTAAIAGPAVAAYIAVQRGRLQHLARPLPPALRDAMRAHFHADLLAGTQLCVTEALPLPQLLWNLPGVPHASAIGGITFDSLIATRHTPDPAFLFHELVHVAQYRLLGVSRFARLYVRGFLEGGSYENIPLEQCAYHLEDRFRSGGIFSVEAAVKDWLAIKQNSGSAW